MTQTSATDSLNKQRVIKNKTSQTGITDWLSVKGRIGRFAYFFYSIILPVLSFWMFAALAGLSNKIFQSTHLLAYVFIATAILSALFIFFKLTIQRCHDFNASGWLSLLTLIPLTFILFCLLPGNAQTNLYGKSSAEPSTLLKLGSMLLLASIIAAVTFWSLRYFLN